MAGGAPADPAVGKQTPYNPRGGLSQWPLPDIVLSATLVRMFPISSGEASGAGEFMGRHETSLA